MVGVAALAILAVATAELALLPGITAATVVLVGVAASATVRTDADQRAYRLAVPDEAEG